MLSNVRITVSGTSVCRAAEYIKGVKARVFTSYEDGILTAKEKVKKRTKMTGGAKILPDR